MATIERKANPDQRKYGYHRDYGRVDVDIAREKLAEQVIAFAWHQQSDVVLVVKPDGSASAHMVGVIATERLLAKHVADVVGTYPPMYHGSRGQRAKIKARILADLRHHFPGGGEKVAA